MLTREIWLADLDPSEGFEQSGNCPVLIISGNSLNAKSGLVIICPLTSKIKNLAGCVMISPGELNGLSVDSEILIFQIRTVSSSRLKKKIGAVSKDVHSLF